MLYICQYAEVSMKTQIDTLLGVILMPVSISTVILPLLTLDTCVTFRTKKLILSESNIFLAARNSIWRMILVERLSNITC